MGGFILYIIKSTLFLTIFYSFFMLVMRRTTFFRFNRIAFILGTAICMVLPFMNIELPAGNTLNAPIMAIESALSPEITALPGSIITAGEASATNIRLIDVLFVAGAIVSFLITMVSYAGMQRMINSAHGTTADGMNIKVIDKDFPSFSWGKTIVISSKDLTENPAILTHEAMHVKCGHSIDLLAYTVITTLHWFNPLIWIARTELKMLHEYEADELTIKKGIDATQYQLLLVKKAVGAKRFQLANGFNHSKLKNRISMMHKNKTNKWMRLAYILCVPALIGAMCCCSNRNNSVNEEEQPIPFELLFTDCSAQITSSDGHLNATLRDCEKPLAEDMYSANLLLDAVNAKRRSGYAPGAVLQIGSQRRSGRKYMAAKDFINSGRFGDVSYVHLTWNVNQPRRWRKSEELIKSLKKEDIDWNLWLLDRDPEAYPFDPRKYLEFRLFWPFSSGVTGQWMCHQIDTVAWFMGMPYPKSAVSSGGLYQWVDGRQSFDTFTTVMEYGESGVKGKGFQVMFQSHQ
ncbi:MAG: hypothetical protein IJ971_02890, partial [Bacteroidales bacterium]|nr:hypothetical protein [Bacteroidales bacterium]